MTRYRYVLCGVVAGMDKISDFRIIDGGNVDPELDGHVAVRVKIPSDLVLTKDSGETYATTKDERTLEELGYDILIWHGKEREWRVHNEFKGVNPCDIFL